MDSLPYSTEYKPVAIHSGAQNRPNGTPCKFSIEIPVNIRLNGTNKVISIFKQFILSVPDT